MTNLTERLIFTVKIVSKSNTKDQKGRYKYGLRIGQKIWYTKSSYDLEIDSIVAVEPFVYTQFATAEQRAATGYAAEDKLLVSILDPQTDF